MDTGSRASDRRSQFDTESFGRRRRSRSASSAAVRSGRRSTSTTHRPVASRSARIAAPTAYTGPPSRPARVTIASPRDTSPRTVRATCLSGVPSNRPANVSVQSTCTPTFAGRSGATASPRSTKGSTHPPSDPRRGQDAPPRAKTDTSAATGSSAPVEGQVVTSPTGPRPPTLDHDTELGEPREPGADQRCRPERLREHASAGPDERRLAQTCAPVAQVRGPERLQHRREPPGRVGVARQERHPGPRSA